MKRVSHQPSPVGRDRRARRGWIEHGRPGGPSLPLLACAVVLASCLLPLGLTFAASTISTNNSFAYGANIGWMDWRGDAGTNGVVIGEFVVSGHIYAANVGWISLGSGSPTNGIQYTNNSANDFGVNNLGDGRLRGFGYGANIGWVNFEPTGDPRINLLTGNFSGFAYSANCGWISLSNAQAFVKTDFCVAGADTDGDGIADAWELQRAGNLTTLTGTGDADGDGVKDVDEYRADTNPLDPSDGLRITAIAANAPGDTATLTWTSRPTRLYQVQSRTDLVAGAWATNSPPGLVSPDFGLTTTRSVTDAPVSNRFYRVQAIQPLKP
jgi:hypothetical protein